MPWVKKIEIPTEPAHTCNLPPIYEPKGRPSTYKRVIKAGSLYRCDDTDCSKLWQAGLSYQGSWVPASWWKRLFNPKPAAPKPRRLGPGDIDSRHIPKPVSVPPEPPRVVSRG